MSRVNSIILCTSLAASAAFCFGQNALAQRGVDPNLGHFYMARQQVEILDAGPVVNNRMQPPPQPGQAAPPGNGALPGGPMQLAPARWQQYSPTETPPALNTNLPKTDNRLPKKVPLPVADHGHPGRIEAANKAKAM